MITDTIRARMSEPVEQAEERKRTALLDVRRGRKAEELGARMGCQINVYTLEHLGGERGVIGLREVVESEREPQRVPARRVRRQTSQKFKAWGRSETLALALHQCVKCRGTGMLLGAWPVMPCGCVLRVIYHTCHELYERCLNGDRSPADRKCEEYVADFTLIAQRTLTGQDRDLFRYYVLQRRGWQYCASQLGISRGNFFHRVYQIEEKLGSAFRNTLPYPLFPLPEYFHGASKWDDADYRAARQYTYKSLRELTDSPVPKNTDTTVLGFALKERNV